MLGHFSDPAARALPLMLSSHLPAVLTGMVQVGVGDFFAQASASGFVGQAAYNNRASPAVRISPAISLGPTLRHGRRPCRASSGTGTPVASSPIIAAIHAPIVKRRPSMLSNSTSMIDRTDRTDNRQSQGYVGAHHAGFDAVLPRTPNVIDPGSSDVTRYPQGHLMHWGYPWQTPLK